MAIESRTYGKCKLRLFHNSLPFSSVNVANLLQSYFSNDSLYLFYDGP